MDPISPLRTTYCLSEHALPDSVARKVQADSEKIRKTVNPKSKKPRLKCPWAAGDTAAPGGIESDPNLRQIPIAVMTTSKSTQGEFVHQQARDFEGLIDVMKELGRYWFEIVDRPRQEERRK